MEEPIRFLSICSGIEAASLAFGPLGWIAAGFAEIAPFPSALLAARFGSNMPGEALSRNAPPNFGDFTTIDPRAVGRVDVLCGGTPCQAFSGFAPIGRQKPDSFASNGNEEQAEGAQTPKKLTLLDGLRQLPGDWFCDWSPGNEFAAAPFEGKAAAGPASPLRWARATYSPQGSQPSAEAPSPSQTGEGAPIPERNEPRANPAQRQCGAAGRGSE